MTDTYKVQLSDALVAKLLLATFEQPHGGGGLDRLVAGAVAAGRQLGKLEALEPMDDAMRASVDQELFDMLAATGRHGWVQALRRLQGFLQRYPVRGRPEGADQANGGAETAFPEVDVRVPPDLIQHVASAKLVLDRFAAGDGPFTPGDASRIAGVLDEWWQAAPPPGSMEAPRA